MRVNKKNNIKLNYVTIIKYNNNNDDDKKTEEEENDDNITTRAAKIKNKNFKFMPSIRTTSNQPSTHLTNQTTNQINSVGVGVEGWGSADDNNDTHITNIIIIVFNLTTTTTTQHKLEHSYHQTCVTS